MADNKTLVDQLINLIANETEPQANTNTRVAAALTALRDYFDENIQDPDEFLQFVLQTKSSDEKRVARSNIDAAQSGGATGTLKQVEDALGDMSQYTKSGGSTKTAKDLEDDLEDGLAQLAGGMQDNTDRLDYNDSVERLRDANTNILKAWTDKDGKLIAYITGDGIFHAMYFDNKDLKSLKTESDFVKTIETLDLKESGILKAWTDETGKVVMYVDDKGMVRAPHFSTLSETKETYNADHIAIWADKDGKVVAWIDKTGVFYIPHLNSSGGGDGIENINLILSNKIIQPYSKESYERLSKLVFREPGVKNSPATMPYQGEAMFTIGDDDTIDLRLSQGSDSRGGFLNTLFPVCASAGVIAVEAMEGWRCGIDVGELNKVGKVALDLQQKAGWEIACHTMTARFGSCFAVDSIAEANAFPDHPVSGGDYTSNRARRIYVVPENKTYYWATNSTWQEVPREYIPPFITDYDTDQNIDDHPQYDMEYQYGEYKKNAERLGFDPITNLVVVAATHSYRKRMAMKQYYKGIFSSTGFSSTNNYYIRPPLTSCIMRNGSFELGENDPDNTATDNLFNNTWKPIIDRTIAEGAYLNINVHMYRHCWINKIDSELVSNGGTYPDEWVFPVDDPDDNPNYLDAPKTSTGLASWEDWHPCPGTRLYQLWRCLKYIKENSRMVSHKQMIDTMENAFEIGDWTNGRGDTVISAPFDDPDYNHFVVGVDGSTKYRNL